MESTPEPKHSPLPWGIESTENNLWIGPMRTSGGKIKEIVLNVDRDRGYKPEVRDKIDANASLIVTAVNSHAHLVEANRRLIEALTKLLSENRSYEPVLVDVKLIQECDNAITFAESKP